MSIRIVLSSAAAFLLAIAVTASNGQIALEAQEPPPAPAETPRPVPAPDSRKPAAPHPRPAQAPDPQEGPRPGPARVRSESNKSVNIRVEATIIESRGDQTIGRRTISATMVDGENASVRSTAFVPMRAVEAAGQGTVAPIAPVQQTRAQLNMDAKARLRPDGRVQVWMTVESQSAGIDLGDAGKATEATIRQSVSVLLDPGTPVVVAQSADAVGNRRLALEVKATVLK